VDERNVRQLFSPFGEIKHVELQDNIAYIEYSEQDQALEAIKNFNNVEATKGRRLKVGVTPG